MNKTHRITLIGWTLAMAVCLGFARPSSAQPAKDPANAALAYAKLKTLAGKWEATTDKGKVTTTYQLVSGGTALLERMEMGAGHEMITVYYIDGNRLLLTHYCEAGNQPRMRAPSIRRPIRLTFSFSTPQTYQTRTLGICTTSQSRSRGRTKWMKIGRFTRAANPASPCRSYIIAWIKNSVEALSGAAPFWEVELIARAAWRWIGGCDE
jgi:hypothetical protein